MEYQGLIIADLHVGAMNLDRTYKEFTEILLSYIKKNKKKLDFIVIAGDFFDHKFFLHDKETELAYKMISDLCDICEDKIKLRFVYGTESHECNQYSLLMDTNLFDRGVDLRVIKYVAEEELMPGLNVLYLPEEHIYDKEAYYEDFFAEDKKYDYIFGHGVINEVMTEFSAKANNQTSTKRMKVPTFGTGELGRICKGQVFFGHFHINRNMDDKFFSIGSFSRWKFGEEGDKGFYHIKCNPEEYEYDANYIVNDMAESFTTIAYGYDHEAFKDEEVLHTTLDHMENMIDNDVIDNVKFVFNIPTDIENPEATINYIKERFKFKDNIKVEIQHGYIAAKKDRENTKLEKEDDELDFVRDKDLPLPEKASRFISIEYRKDIPSSRIEVYMYKKLDEILNEIEEDT